MAEIIKPEIISFWRDMILRWPCRRGDFLLWLGYRDIFSDPSSRCYSPRSPAFVALGHFANTFRNYANAPLTPNGKVRIETASHKLVTSEHPHEVERSYEPIIFIHMNGAPLGHQRVRGEVVAWSACENDDLKAMGLLGKQRGAGGSVGTRTSETG